MKQIYNILLLFLFSGNIFSQTLVIDHNLKQKEKLESIILQYKNFDKDTIALKIFLDPLIKSKKTDLQTLYYCLLADAYSKGNKNINSKSNYYYKKSLENAKSEKNKGLEVWVLANYAFYLYTYDKISESLQIYMDADNIINKINPNTIVLPSDCFKKIGYFMGTIGDPKEAIDYLKKAERFSKPNSKEMAEVKFNLASYYIEINDITNAEKYLSQTQQLSINIKDYIRYAKVLGNLAILEQKKENYAKAEKYLIEDISISEKYKDYKNKMFALILLSKAYINQNKISQAKITLQKATKYAISKSYYKRSEYDIVKLSLDIAVKEKDNSKELVFRRRLNELEESLIHGESDKNLKKSNMLAQKERYGSKLNLANAQYEKEQLKNKTIIIVSVLLLCIIFLLIIFNQKKLKIRKDKYDKTVLKLELEKIKSEQKLSETNNTLSSYSIYLTEKNEQIELLNKELKK